MNKPNSRNERRIYLQPTPVRIWHWLNALGIVTLGISGIQVRFPEHLNLLGSYRAAVELHNVAGLLVAISFALWFFYYTCVAHRMTRTYVPTREDLRHGLLRQGIYYFWNYFQGKPSPHHPTPENKFNPLQKSAYLTIMFVLMPLVGLTGILLMNVSPLRQLVLMAGGLKILIGLHFLLACALFAFLFTHLYLATLGRTPLAYIKPMWTGWEELESAEHLDVQTLARGCRKGEEP